MDKELIFHAALELSDPLKRASFLDDACGNDAALRAEIDDLLKHDAELGSFLDSRQAAAGTVAHAPISEVTGTQIGPYKLLEQIGEGGMGVVYMAAQQTPVRRRVALKIIKPGMDTRQVIARFEAERQALALMDHPNIARVLDAGATESGLPYFVMELVRGIPVTDYCDQNNLSVPERLDLFVQVCHAVQHAHHKGVIHRDLKPSNVLVTLHDGQPVPKVIDFGVAKATNQQLTEKTLFTNFSQMVGTPLYMSPEQAEMSGLDIDTRSDIYSMGVLLYELLTGTTPFDRRRLSEAAYDEIRRIIREEEPPKPSTRLSTLGETRTAMAAHRKITPDKLAQLMRGDLDWIVMKALEKDRTRRYETANGLARDVQRYLSNQPIEARPPSASYKFRKFAQRNRPALLTGLAVGLALLCGTILSTWQAIRATRAENQAVAARLDEAAQREIAEDQRTLAEAQRVEAENQRAQAEKNFQNARKAVDEYFTLVSESKLFDVQGMQPLRKELMDAALRFYDDFSHERTDDPAVLAELAVTYMRVATINHTLNRNDEGLAAIDKALALIDRLRREFPDRRQLHRKLAGFWKGYRPTRDQTSMPKNPEAAFLTINRLAETLLVLGEENPEEPAFLSDVAALYFHMGLLLSANSRPTDGIVFFKKAVPILEKLSGDEPQVSEHRADLARMWQQIASSAKVVGHTTEAAAAAQESLVIREKLVADLPHVIQHRADLVFSLFQVASVNEMRSPAEAEQLYRRGLKLADSLVVESPATSLFWARRAEAVEAFSVFLSKCGRGSDFAEIQKKGLPALERITADPACHPDGRVALIHAYLWAGGPDNESKAAEFLMRMAVNEPADVANRELLADRLQAFGFMLKNEGQLTTGEKLLRRANELGERMVADAPLGVDRRRALAFCKRELSQICALRPESMEEAEQLHVAELALWDKLNRDFPSHRNDQDQSAHSHRLWGFMHRDAGRHAKAAAAFAAAIPVLDQLISDEPDRLGPQNLRSDTLDSLADELRAAGSFEESEAVFRRLIEQELQRVADHPQESKMRRQGVANHYFELGRLLATMRKLDDADRAFEQSFDGFERLMSDYPNDAGYRPALAERLRNVADAHIKSGRVDHGEALLRRASSVDPSDPWSRHILADLLVRRNRVDEAIGFYRKAIELNPQFVWSHVNLARALAGKDDLTAALAVARDAIRTAQNEPQGHQCLLEILNKIGDSERTVAVLRENARQMPDSAHAQLILGVALHEQEHPDQALTAFLAALTIDPHNGMAFQAVRNLVNDLAGHPDQKRLIERVDKALVDSPRYVDWCAICGRWFDALAGLKKRIEVQPDDHYAWYQAAFVLAQQGDQDEYRRHCAEMLARFGDTQDPNIAERVAKACLILPPPEDQLALATKLARRAMAAGPDHWASRYFQLVGALADYRAGKFTDAAALLDECLHSQKQFGDYLMAASRLLSVVNTARLDDDKRARSEWEQVATMCDDVPQIANGHLLQPGDWHDGIAVEMLRREAEKVIEQRQHNTAE